MDRSRITISRGNFFEQPQRFFSVAGFRDYFVSAFGLEQRSESATDQVMVVHQDDAATGFHGSGTTTAIDVPTPCADAILKWPFNISMRSFIPGKPNPALERLTSKPFPSSRNRVLEAIAERQ
jgi:hypothetical protein